MVDDGCMKPSTLYKRCSTISPKGQPIPAPCEQEDFSGTTTTWKPSSNQKQPWLLPYSGCEESLEYISNRYQQIRFFGGKTNHGNFWLELGFQDVPGKQTKTFQTRAAYHIIRLAAHSWRFIPHSSGTESAGSCKRKSPSACSFFFSENK